MRIKHLCFILVVCAASGPSAEAGDDHGYSGMDKMRGEANHFLAVRDLKQGRDHGPRLLVIRVRTEQEIRDEQKRTGRKIQATEVRTLKLQGLPKDSGGEKIPRLNDLEACCALPGRADEYLLAESGYYKKRYGRIFHVRVSREDGRWTARYLSHFHPFEPPTNEAGTSPKFDEIEGLEVIPSDNGQTLVIGRRGSLPKGGIWTPANVIWGALEFSSDGTQVTGFAEAGREPLRHTPTLVRQRGCSDLHLRKRDNTWALWTVATHDDGDVGPFRSIVYEAGVFSRDASGALRFTTPKVSQALFQIRGLKIEGLAGPAEAVDDSHASIATECEAYGGVWRPVQLIRAPEERCPVPEGARTPTTAAFMGSVQDQLAKNAALVPMDVIVVQFRIMEGGEDTDHCVFHFARQTDGTWSDARPAHHPGLYQGNLERREVMSFTMGKPTLSKLWSSTDLDAFRLEAKRLRSMGHLAAFGGFANGPEAGLDELFALLRH